MHGGAEHEHLRVAFLQREPERGRTAEREEVVGTCAKPEGGKGFRKEGVDSRVKCGQEASREEGAGGGGAVGTWLVSLAGAMPGAQLAKLAT